MFIILISVIRYIYILFSSDYITMDLHAIHRIAPISGFGLSIEEFSGLEVATAVRKLEENLVGKMQFWGKIFGTTQDYLIIYHVDPFAEFPDKKYYYW